MAAQLAERAGGVAAHQGVEQVDDPAGIGEPEHLPHVFRAHRAGCMGDRLVEQRERVAHRAFGGARDQRQRFRLRRHPFLGENAFEMGDQHAGFDPAQVEPLAARQHRDRDLADFGGREHELGVGRRLLQGLQQRVEGLGRQHVHLVEDVDLVAGAHRRVAHGIIDLSDVVDAVVGGGVHFQHVHMPAFHDRPAIEAEHRHLDGRRGDRAVRQLVIQAAGEDAGGGGLADAAHPGEDPGLRDAPGLERVRDRPHHGLLADQVVEGGGTVFAREHAVAGALARRGRRIGCRTVWRSVWRFKCKIETRLREAAGCIGFAHGISGRRSRRIH